MFIKVSFVFLLFVFCVLSRSHYVNLSWSRLMSSIYPFKINIEPPPFWFSCFSCFYNQTPNKKQLKRESVWGWKKLAHRFASIHIRWLTVACNSSGRRIWHSLLAPNTTIHPCAIKLATKISYFSSLWIIILSVYNITVLTIFYMT